MKINLLIFFWIIFIPLNGYCDQVHYNAIEKTVNSFLELDDTWRELNSYELNLTMRKFRGQLKSKSEEFKIIRLTVNKELYKPFSDYAEIFLDVSNDINSLLENNAPYNLKDVRFKLSFIAHVSLGVSRALVDIEKGNTELFLTDEEQDKIKNLIQTKFGNRIKGKEVVNGDTPFSMAISVIDGFLRNYK